MRWIKLLRDIRAESGRGLIMLAAIAFALFAVTTMLSAYGIVTREVAVNYLGTNPASRHDRRRRRHARCARDGTSLSRHRRRRGPLRHRSARKGRQRVDAHAALRRRRLRDHAHEPLHAGLGIMAATTRHDAPRAHGGRRHRRRRRRHRHDQDAERRRIRSPRFRHRPRHDARAGLAGTVRLRLSHDGDLRRARRARRLRGTAHPS